MRKRVDMVDLIPRADIIDITDVFGKGKTTIPAAVRLKLDIRDKDKVIWYRKGEEICIMKVGLPRYSTTTG